ncbi:hypothetical protein [Actinomadura parmotrematis]|uniref:Uncharacterized protein n=1 Tax=Actinomadura parmotrematis TaxID=2864039 RepID=A0ABS7G6K6_9ACTN|nr:hypothetical protein [Actinomadura parmotrematis]MBW8487452.1 hypothetical protein [Actinomadura parmotrematis]
MGYPGDQGKPGGRPSAGRPPQGPYAPGAERPPAAPYGGDEAGWDDDPTDRSPRAAGGGHGQPSFGPPPSYGRQADDTDVQVAGQRFAPHDRDGGLYQGGHYGNEQFPTGGFPVVDDGYENGPGGPGGPGGGYGGAQFDGAPDGSARASKRRTPLVVGGALVAGLVLVGGGFGAAAMLKKDDPKPAKKAPAAGTAPAAQATPSPSETPLEPVKLKSRDTDPQPLTAKEFGKSGFSADQQKYKRAAFKSGSCSGVVAGAKLVAAVKKAGCSQALRTTYTRTDGKLVGTVGVLNLKTEDGAKSAARAALAKDAYLKPLPGGGTTAKIGVGEAVGTAQAQGHYLVMTWVQRPNGKKIPDASQKYAQAFAQAVIKGSGLTYALAYRETEGKPFHN